MNTIIINKEIEKKVWDYLKEALGEDADGIYCTDSSYNGDCDDIEEVYSQYNKKDGVFFYVEDSANYSISCGCSRMAIIPENESFIIKLPITGNFAYAHIYSKFDENNIEIDRTTEYSCYPDDRYLDEEMAEEGWVKKEEKCFLSRERNESVDLMQLENDFYDQASDNLQLLLVPNTYVGNYNGIPVYIQKKVDTTYDNASADRVKFYPLSDKDKEMIDKLTSSNRRNKTELGDCFLKICMNYYNFSVDEILELIDEMDDLGVANDLHGSNIGLTEDNAPCIFDYAGYDDNLIWA